MILYHVSFDEPDLPNNRKQFAPRIPQTYAEEEDRTEPRICFAKSMQQAISACACADVMRVFNFFHLEPTVYVYQIETDRLADEDWLGSEAVRAYVPDALDSGECWLLRPVELAAKRFVAESATFRAAGFGPKSPKVSEIVKTVSLRLAPDEPSNVYKLIEAQKIGDDASWYEQCCRSVGVKVVCSVLAEAIRKKGQTTQRLTSN